MEAEEVLKLAKLYRNLSNEIIDEFRFITEIQFMVADIVGLEHKILDFEATHSEILEAEKEIMEEK